MTLETTLYWLTCVRHLCPCSPDLNAYLVRADQLSVVKLDEEQVLAQMRTTVSAGYETVSAVISVSNFRTHLHALHDHIVVVI